MNSLLKWWEFVLWLVPTILAVLLAVQRELVFSKGNYGLFTEDSLPLFIWALIGLVMLLASQPWKPVSKVGSYLRYSGIVLAGVCAIFVLLCSTSWGRYRILRFEALTANLGVTNYGKVKLAYTLMKEADTGRYIVSDQELRNFAFHNLGHDFLTSPKSASALVEAELNAGTGFQELLDKPQGGDILLGVLASQAISGPWTDPAWPAKPPEALINKEQGQELVGRLSEQVDKLSSETLEYTVFALMNFPELFQDAQREALLKAWVSGFSDLQPLALEGLVLRGQVSELLPKGKDPVSISVDITGGLPSKYYYRNVDKIAKLLCLGLVRSCGVSVKETEGGESDLTISVVLSQIAHHTYSKPTYSYESYYEHHYSGVGLRRVPYKVKKTREVISGSTQETAYAPVARITLSNETDSLELPEMLLFWHHLRYDKEKKRFTDLKNEKTFGRIWPFGVHKRLFERGLDER